MRTTDWTIPESAYPHLKKLETDASELLKSSKIKLLQAAKDVVASADDSTIKALISDKTERSSAWLHNFSPDARQRILAHETAHTLLSKTNAYETARRQLADLSQSEEILAVFQRCAYLKKMWERDSGKYFSQMMREPESIVATQIMSSMGWAASIGGKSLDKSGLLSS